MDSKKEAKAKFKKNRNWSRKYQPRKGNTTEKSLSPKVTELNYESSESETGGILNQPVPRGGWIPEDDLESGDESFILLKNSTLKKELLDNDKDHRKKLTTDIDEKQLLTLDLAREKSHIIIYEDELKQKVETKLKEESKDNKIDATNDIENLINQLKKRKPVHVPKQEKVSNDPEEEEELNLLLSLKEPVHSKPFSLNKKMYNDRRVNSESNAMHDKPTKSIDLEKWLDSVLDT